MSKLCVIVYVLIVLCISWSVAEESAPKPSGYETKYDNVDLDEILKNDRLRKNYIKCLLSEGPCTPDAQELKNSLPDAITTNCSKCTEKQRSGSEKVTHYFIDNQPDEWDQLAAIYDKDGEYKQKYIESKMRDQMGVGQPPSDTVIANGENVEQEPKQEANDETKQE